MPWISVKALYERSSTCLAPRAGEAVPASRRRRERAPSLLTRDKRLGAGKEA